MNEPILQNLIDPRQYRNSSPDINADEQRVPNFGRTDASNVSNMQQAMNEHRNMEMIENLESQLQNMNDVVRKTEEQQRKLKDTISQKGNTPT